MDDGRRFRFLLTPLFLVAVAALLFAACEDEGEEGGTPAPGETPPSAALGDVDVLGIWGGDELESFEALLAPWEAETGGEVDFVGTRDITALLSLNVEGGTPPDIAVPGETGLFKQFAAAGELTPLSECPGLEEKILAEYPQAFIDLGTVDGTLYGFIMKTSNKGVIFYNPGFFADKGYTPLTGDASFDDLIALSDEILAGGTPPWTNGQFANGGTGFPGSDTIQQILLNEAGGDVYDGLIDGSVPFTDSVVKDAWEKFGQLALSDGYVVQGGADAINATGFIDSSYPPFESPPTAAMLHMGSFAAGFIADQFPDAVADEDFAFFPWPGGAVTGDLNIVYAFNSDETTCSFLDHLASADAQQIWVERGGFTSVNTQVPVDAYATSVDRAAAEGILNAPAFRHDLDDAIGGALQTAFFTGVTDYLADPGSLDAILAGIEAAREVPEE